MKKRFLLVLIMLLISITLTGCGETKNEDGGNSKEKTILKKDSGTKTCTKTSIDEDGYNETDTMVIKYKKNKVKIVENTIITETDPEYIDFTIGFGEEFAKVFNEIKGFEVNYAKEDENKIKMYMKIDYDKIDIDDIKEKLGELYSEEEAFYNEKDITIDDFIKENLSEYTCE